MNPEMRKYMRKAKIIAEKSNVGDKVMCPCGCMNNFKKQTKTQCFNRSKGDSCKTTYYNRIRRTNNPPLKMENHQIIRKMSIYISMKEKELKLINKTKRIENIDNKLDFISNLSLQKNNNDTFSDHFISLMKQTKEISKMSAPNTDVVCPCGCAETFKKTTKDNTYNRIEGNKHKDDFYSKIKGEIKIEENEENLKSLNKMNNYIKERSSKLKVEMVRKRRKMTR